MRTIPEIVAEMRELIEELESHTGKPPAPAPSNLNFSLYDNMNMNGGYDTISLTGGAGQSAMSFSLHDIKPLDPSDLSFTTKS